MKRNFSKYRVAVYSFDARYYPEEGGFFVPYNYVSKTIYTDDLEKAKKAFHELAEAFECTEEQEGFARYYARYMGEGTIVAIESRYDKKFARPNAYRIPRPGIYC